MKIYDCFTFYNELDLLELRLKELYDYVDHFVIVESDQTFTNKSKPWNFDTQRFQPFMDKIIYVQVEDSPTSSNPWDNERHQRNAIMRGLVDASPEDIVLVSDLDEIIRPQTIEHLRNSEQTLWALRMPLFNFKFNYMRVGSGQYDVWAMAARASALQDITPESLRNMRFQFFSAPLGYNNSGCEVIEHAGWHFGYLGNKEFLLDKARSFSHTEVNTPEFLAQIDPEASIQKRTSWKQDSDDRYEIIPIDDYLPKTVVENQSAYAGYILDNPSVNALDVLPKHNYN